MGVAWVAIVLLADISIGAIELHANELRRCVVYGHAHLVIFFHLLQASRKLQ